MHDLRLVVDTNVFVSRLLLPRSLAAQAFDKALAEGRLLMSEATLAELARVLARPKFDRYVDLRDRQSFIEYLAPLVEIVGILQQFTVCRDARDDMFLDVAINGRADAVITGDSDLLALDPFMGVRVLTPSAWLQDGLPQRTL